MSHPKNAKELIGYLKENPTLKVKFPGKECKYTYAGYEGDRVKFISSDGHSASFLLSAKVCGVIKYDESGFTRTVAGITAYFCYEQGELSEWKTRMMEWDEIFAIAGWHAMETEWNEQGVSYAG